MCVDESVGHGGESAGIAPAAPVSFFDEATRQWAGRGPRGSRGGALDAAPDLPELAQYFGRLSQPRLAGCWVGCIVDCCIGSDLSPGDMARALVVVAERLHGVVFAVPVKGVAMSRMANADGTGAVGGSSGGSGPAGRAAAVPRTVGKYELHNAEPPEPAGRKSKYAEAIVAAMALPASGGWFEWVDGPKTFSSPARSKKMSKATRLEVLVYKSTGGKVIVKRIGKA